MTFERKSRVMPSFGRSRMCNDVGTGGSGGVHLLMSDERIPVRCLLLSRVGMKHVISWDEVLEEKKGNVK